MEKNKITITTASVEETKTLGEKLGEYINKPAIITLKGDLGSGKTSFVQGLAKGLEVPDDFYVNSPTYSIINEYPGKFPLFHIDFYRIKSIDDLENLGFNEIVESGGIIAIEWPEIIPENDIDIDISIEFHILNDDSRKISALLYGHNPPDLIENLK